MFALDFTGEDDGNYDRDHDSDDSDDDNSVVAMNNEVQCRFLFLNVVYFEVQYDEGKAMTTQSVIFVGCCSSS